ncbi:hypothetical protein LCGC14_0664800 [marine sediment metagenome]|uniref:Uncharacterized protein n=1 Tax=marine sediment metagenome TaxID=412755 RepID=A0A0F9QXR9_9ZZZZ
MAEKKKEMMVRRTKETILLYSFNPTIRQVFYRLISSQDLRQTKSDYVYFDKVITIERKKDLEFANHFNDKTRTLNGNINRNIAEGINVIIENRLESIRIEYPQIEYEANNLQSNITVILLEKQALESVFFQILEQKFGYILVVARGFNSFTQMNQLRKLIKDDERKLHLVTFGDYDDSGKLIKENFINQCKEYLGITFDMIKDVALTKEQTINLPKNPVKNSTHRTHQIRKGEEVDYYVELDALEPNILQQLLEIEVDKYIDYDIYNAMNKALKVRNRRLQKRYFKRLRKLDLSNVGFV